MRIVEVYWTPRVNMINLICDCGVVLVHPTNVSLVICPICNNMEWWHEDAKSFNDKIKVADIPQITLINPRKMTK